MIVRELAEACADDHEVRIAEQLGATNVLLVVRVDIARLFVCGEETMQLKPCFFAKIFASIGIDSSVRYSSSPATSTIFLPPPAPPGFAAISRYSCAEATEPRSARENRSCFMVGKKRREPIYRTKSPNRTRKMPAEHFFGYATNFRSRSVTSLRLKTPAATARVRFSQSSLSGWGFSPLSCRKTRHEPSAARLLPSING